MRDGFLENAGVGLIMSEMDGVETPFMKAMERVRNLEMEIKTLDLRLSKAIECLKYITRATYGTELPRCEQDEHDNNEILARHHWDNVNQARKTLREIEGETE